MENYHANIAGRQKEIVEEIQILGIDALQIYKSKPFKASKALATEWIVNDMVPRLYHSKYFDVKTIEDAYRILSREKDFVNKLEQCEFDYILKKSTIQLETVLPKQMKRLSEFNNVSFRRCMLVMTLAQCSLAILFWSDLIERELLKKVYRIFYLMAVSGSIIPMLIFHKEWKDNALGNMFMKTTRRYAQAALTERLSK